MPDSKISALTAATSLAGTDEFVIATGGASKKVTMGMLPGYEVAFVQSTTAVTVTATVEASSDTILTLSAATYAAVPHIFQFSWPSLQLAGTGTQAVIVSLFDGSTQVCRIWQWNEGTIGYWGGQTAQVRYTPTAGTHTFSVRGFRAGGASHTYQAGSPPAAGVFAPIQLRAMIA